MSVHVGRSLRSSCSPSPIASRPCHGEARAARLDRPGRLRRRFASRSLLGAGLMLATSSPACIEEPPEEDYGSIRVQMRSDDQGNADPFEDTSSLIVKVFYNQCIQNFYAVSRPDLSLEDGPGRQIFAEWEGRVCSSYDPDSDPWPEGERSYIGCSFEADSWQQEVQEASDEWFLKMRLTVDDDDMGGRHLRVGPVPREVLTGCKPLVKIQNSSIVGVDEDSKTMWTIGGSQRTQQGPDSNQAVLVEIVSKNKNTDDDSGEDGGDED